MVQKDIVDEIIVENWSNLTNHPYYLIIDIKKFYPRLRKSSQRTRVVNIHNNTIDEGHAWQGYTTIIQ